MTAENVQFDRLKDVVKYFIKEGFSLDDFMGTVESAILEAIVEGCMFVDYLHWRYKIEDPNFMPYDEDEWDDILIKAMGENKEEYMDFASCSKNDSLREKLGLEPKKMECGPDADEAIKKHLVEIKASGENRYCQKHS